jgi:hypothetical protein
MIWGHLARFMIRLHPPAWRRRYEDEVAGLVSIQPATWRDATDLFLSAVQEQIGSRFGDSHKEHRMRQLIRASTLAMLAVALGLLALPLVATLFGVVWLVANGDASTIWPFVAARLDQTIEQSFQVMPVLAFYAAWCLLPAVTAAAVCHRILFLRRRPWLSRTLTTATFVAIPLWLMPIPATIVALMAGLTFSSIVFRAKASDGSRPTPIIPAVIA